MTMPDELDRFRKRVDLARKGAKIAIRPVDPAVSYVQHS